MRLFVIPGLFVCAWIASAQMFPGRSTALPPDPADAVDQAVLRRTLYGNLPADEISAREVQGMVDAAARMLDRRKARVELAKQLVEEGVMPRLALTPFLEDLDQSRRTLGLAQSRASLFQETAEMARVEAAVFDNPAPSPSVIEKYPGGRPFRAGDLKAIGDRFAREFGRPLPVSARGATAFHRSLGYDHRGRADVAVSPDDPEGVWLRTYLQALRIPYIAFRGALPGRASGAHVHIGPPSERLRHGG